MEKVFIAKLYRTNTKKDGTKYESKFGPFERVTITDDNGKFIGLNDYQGLTKNWAEGMTVELDVRETEWQGKKRFEGTIPNMKGQYNQKMDSLIEDVKAIGKMVSEIHTAMEAKKLITTVSGQDFKKSGSNPAVDEDLPF